MPARSLSVRRTTASGNLFPYEKPGDPDVALKRRLQLIGQIERERSSRVISYITSTRQGIDVQMALDTIGKVFDHLEAITGDTKKGEDPPAIDLFIHSNGGETTVPWRLVTLLREYTDKLSVIVPHRAFSAATLTALGADEIVMHPMGMLGPTDATVKTPFNPAHPMNANQKLGISVEDVTAYINLIREDAGIQHEDELVQAFNKLVEKVHPLALGAVKRTLSQSRMMARKLLSLHMDASTESHKIDEIVDNLTSKLFFHGHPINRKEAQIEIGLRNVKEPSKKLEKHIWDLYKQYEDSMQLDRAFNAGYEFTALYPNLAVGSEELSACKIIDMVTIESSFRTDRFEYEYQLHGVKQPNGGTAVTTINRREEWVSDS